VTFCGRRARRGTDGEGGDDVGNPHRSARRRRRAVGTRFRWPWAGCAVGPRQRTQRRHSGSPGVHSCSAEWRKFHCPSTCRGVLLGAGEFRDPRGETRRWPPRSNGRTARAFTVRASCLRSACSTSWRCVDARSGYRQGDVTTEKVGVGSSDVPPPEHGNSAQHRRGCGVIGQRLNSGDSRRYCASRTTAPPST
jgi:hypothetical protein